MSKCAFCNGESPRHNDDCPTIDKKQRAEFLAAHDAAPVAQAPAAQDLILCVQDWQYDKDCPEKVVAYLRKVLDGKAT